MYLTDNIKTLRETKGLTQADLGAIMGVSGTQMTRYEKGDSTPSVERLIMIADFFNITLQDLVFTDLSKKPPQHRRLDCPCLDQEELDSLRELNFDLQQRLHSLEEKIKRIDPGLAKE